MIISRSAVSLSCTLSRVDHLVLICDCIVCVIREIERDKKSEQPLAQRSGRWEPPYTGGSVFVAQLSHARALLVVAWTTPPFVGGPHPDLVRKNSGIRVSLNLTARQLSCKVCGSCSQHPTLCAYFDCGRNDVESGWKRTHYLSISFD